MRSVGQKIAIPVGLLGMYLQVGSGGYLGMGTGMGMGMGMGMLSGFDRYPSKLSTKIVTVHSELTVQYQNGEYHAPSTAAHLLHPHLAIEERQSSCRSVRAA